MKKVNQCWLYLNLRASFKILKITVAGAVDWDKSVNIHIRAHNILQDPNLEIGTLDLVYRRLESSFMDN